MPNKEKKQITIAELAILTGSELVGIGDTLITGVADLDSATPSDVSFLANPRYEKAMAASQAGAVIMQNRELVQESRTYLITDDPSRAFQSAIEFFLDGVPQHTGFHGVHGTSVIADSVTLGDDVVVGPHTVIEFGAVIGKGTVIAPNCTIGQNVTIGEGCVIHPSVVIQANSVIGNRVLLHPGVVVGSDGFGFTTGADGRHEKLAQLGNVVIEDDVEVGANSCIDRARFKETRIRCGTKIDNMVQVGHGVEVGEHNLLVAQVGIAGSTKLGRHVVIAGQSAIVGHVEIADGVIIAGKSGVIKSIKEPGIYGGMPAGPVDDQRKRYVHIRNLDKHVKTLNELKKRVGELEKSSS